MMTNLFSSFDPSTSYQMSLNWSSIMLIIPVIPLSYWMLPSRNTTLIFVIKTSILKQLNPIMSSNLLLISLFMMVALNNASGLMPYIFTSTSHMTLTMTLAFSMWLSFIMYGWTKNTSKSLAHLVPSGTPKPLMMFMVMIEMISILIRPLTLAIRLSANMIAGHLLITLLGNQIATLPTLTVPLMLIIQILLITLEAAVSIIQAYVITILLTLYASEAK